MAAVLGVFLVMVVLALVLPPPPTTAGEPAPMHPSSPWIWAARQLRTRR